MKIYGWLELNDCCYGQISCLNIDKCKIKLLDEDAQEVSVYDVEQGRWFMTFAAAKKAAICILTNSIAWERRAIAAFRELKKTDVIEGL